MSTQDLPSQDAGTVAIELLKHAGERGIMGSPNGLRQLVLAACECARLVVQRDIKTHPKCIREGDGTQCVRLRAQEAIEVAERWTGHSSLAAVDAGAIVQKLDALRAEWKAAQGVTSWRPCAEHAVGAADAAAESAVAAAEALRAASKGFESQAAAKCLESAVKAARAAGDAWTACDGSNTGHLECAKAVRLHVKIHS